MHRRSMLAGWLAAVQPPPPTPPPVAPPPAAPPPVAPPPPAAPPPPVEEGCCCCCCCCSCCCSCWLLNGGAFCNCSLLSETTATPFSGSRFSTTSHGMPTLFCPIPRKPPMPTTMPTSLCCSSMMRSLTLPISLAYWLVPFLMDRTLRVEACSCAYVYDVKY